MKHNYQNQVWWCLPGGQIERNETPEEAAVSELKEECNVSGKIIRIINVRFPG